MARPGPCDAPQELIDEIIDHCSGDKGTLIACSLTSRAWVHRTRKYLFSTLTLTDKTLPVWGGTVAAPTISKSVPLPSTYPLHLSSNVTSLQLVPKYSRRSQGTIGVKELLRAKPHLSTFTNLKSLALTCISFLKFSDGSLKACFGPFAKVVSELKLSACPLDEERFFTILRLFTRLESLEVDGIPWHHSTSAERKDLPTPRGSFTASGFVVGGLLKSLATTKVEYHTITLGWNPPSTLFRFNALLAKCKDHLKTLSLTAPEWGASSVGNWLLPYHQLDWTDGILSS